MSSVYSNYVKRMRMCANENCKGCTYQYEGLTNTEECKEDLLYDAANALEDADKSNAELLKKCKEKEKLIAELEAQNKLKDGTITAMETDIGKLQAAVDNYEKLIAELSAQLPKQAHWVAVDNGHGVCSNCNRQDSIDNMATHCRYCGARMTKGEDK